MGDYVSIERIRYRYPNHDLFFSSELSFEGNDIGIRVQICQAEQYFVSQLQRIVSTGVTYRKLMGKLGEVDLAFITAFLTGDDPNAGGFARRKEGQVGRTGKVYREGEIVNREDNKARSKDLAKLLRGAGYGWVTVKGVYGRAEITFIVFNAVESQSQFVEDMKAVAGAADQDSVIIWLKGGTPYMYYPKTNKKREVTEAEIREVVGDESYTKYRDKKSRIPFPSDDNAEDDEQYLVDAKVYLPGRTGDSRMIIRNWRKKMRATTACLFWLSDDGTQVIRTEGDVEFHNTDLDCSV